MTAAALLDCLLSAGLAVLILSPLIVLVAWIGSSLELAAMEREECKCKEVAK